MINVDTFSAEEWAEIIKTPAMASASVIAADFSVTGVIKEFGAITSSMKDYAEQHASGNSLMVALKEQLVDTSKLNDEMKKSSEKAKGQPAGDPFVQLNNTFDMLKSKGASQAEIKSYKQMCYNAAEAAANAAKEGGFLGIGGKEVVSEKEAAVLADLKSKLGL